MLRQRLAKVHTNGGVKRIKWNMEKLKVEEEQNKYNDALDKKIKEKQIILNTKNVVHIEDKWEVIKDAINEVAKVSICGKSNMAQIFLSKIIIYMSI